MDKLEKVLGKVIDNLEKKKSFTKEEISGAWKKAAGDRVASHSRPVSIKRKVVTIEVDSSSWFYNLSLKKLEILEELQKVLGEGKIRDIRFRMGEIA